MATNSENRSGGTTRTKRTRRKSAAKKPAAAEKKTIEDVARPSERSGEEQPMLPTLGRLVGRGVRFRDITVFLRQLIMLLEAGTPIMKSLKTLAERGERASMRALVKDISEYVEAGNPLWQAFERHPKHFSTVFVNLIKASEASGTLVPVLKGQVEYRERRETLRKRVQGALLYPVILVFAFFGVVVLITKWVIPSLEEMFTKLEVPMPAYTRGFMAVSRFVGTWWWVFPIALIVLGILYALYVRNPLHRLTADRIKLKIPIMGPIIKKKSIVEMCRALSLLLRSGLSMMATLELVRTAIHNKAVAHVVQNLRDSVEQGGGFEEPLRKADDIIPGVVTDMLVTGEEAGSLDQIADQIADTYDEEVTIAVSSLGELLQPILTLLIGALVILVALAVFRPLVDMIQSLAG